MLSLCTFKRPKKYALSTTQMFVQKSSLQLSLGLTHFKVCLPLLNSTFRWLSSSFATSFNIVGSGHTIDLVTHHSNHDIERYQLLT
jgi:hypothetical protein